MFGILFWLIIAVVVLGYLGVGLNRVMAQRQAWKLFADKHKLEFIKGSTFYASAQVLGKIAGREVHIYSMEEGQDNMYLRSAAVHVEVFLHNVPEAMIYVVAKVMPEIVADERLPENISIKGSKFAQSDDAAKANAWLAQGNRMAALEAFVADVDDKSDVLFASTGELAFLLWRTYEPMADAKALNARVQKMFDVAKKLDAEEIKKTA